ncbi:MAG: tetratricopeptide repeat protein, partial [Hyphomonas sp.]
SRSRRSQVLAAAMEEADGEVAVLGASLVDARAAGTALQRQVATERRRCVVGALRSTLEQRAAYLSQAGNAWIEADDPDSALKAFDGALKIAPDAPELLLDRASAHMLLENYDEAIDDLDAVLLRVPGHGEAYQMRGAAWLAKGDPDKAMLDVNAAMEANPEDINTLVLRGQVREALRLQADAGGPIERLETD